MAKKNRSTLKKFFRDGALPTGDQFATLIDSTLNMIDEGFDKSATQGLEISLIGEHSRLISFFKPDDPINPVWTIEYDQDKDRLKIVNPRAQKDTPAAITFSADGKIGINKNNPQQELDVGGVISSAGRLGANPDNLTTVPADSEWYDITPVLSGCQAFEVMAGVGSPGTGRYALIQATAINTFNPSGWWFNFLNRKSRIRYQQAYFMSRDNRIKLRWQPVKDNKDKYTLQIRTACSYGEGINIRFYLTRLWFDETMSGSTAKKDEVKDSGTQ